MILIVPMIWMKYQVIEIKNVDKTNEISNNKKKSGEDIAWNILMKMGWKKGKGIFLII